MVGVHVTIVIEIMHIIPKDVGLLLCEKILVYVKNPHGKDDAG